jgi:hypothetical protein
MENSDGVAGREGFYYRRYLQLPMKATLRPQPASRIVRASKH